MLASALLAVDSRAELAHVISLTDESFLLDRIREVQEVHSGDEWLAAVRSRCDEAGAKFAVRNGVLCKLQGDLYAPVIPPGAAELKRLLFLEVHMAVLGGHLGFHKMKKAILKRFYWKGLGRDLKLFL